MKIEIVYHQSWKKYEYEVNNFSLGIWFSLAWEAQNLTMEKIKLSKICCELKPVSDQQK